MHHVSWAHQSCTLASHYEPCCMTDINLGSALCLLRIEPLAHCMVCLSLSSRSYNVSIVQHVRSTLMCCEYDMHCCVSSAMAKLSCGPCLCLLCSRCPAYVDLYARSSKPQGTWTVYCIVQRGSKGTFSLRSNKNLSILPMATVRTLQTRAVDNRLCPLIRQNKTNNG